MVAAVVIARRGRPTRRRPCCGRQAPTSAYAEPSGTPFHNVAVSGWDELNPRLTTAATIADRLEEGRQRMTWSRNSSRTTRRGRPRPVLQRARKGNRARGRPRGGRRGQQGQGGYPDPGGHSRGERRIGSVVSLDPAWTPTQLLATLSPEGADGRRAGWIERLPAQRFRRGLEALAPCEKLRTIEAQHVLDSHPLGCRDRARRPRDAQEGDAAVAVLPPLHAPVDHRRRGFRPAPRPEHHRHAMDSTIDAYNETIIASVRAQRNNSIERSLLQTWARSWTGSPPGATSKARGPGRPGGRRTSCRPQLNAAATRFRAQSCFQPRTTGPDRRQPVTQLDGVHPTTIGYGIVAPGGHRGSAWSWPGSQFLGRDGQPRTAPVVVDFDRLLLVDTLISQPPAAIGDTLSLLGWLDEGDWVNKFLRLRRTSCEA